MNKPLTAKVRETVRWLHEAWVRTEGKHRFVAFSTGKDSLALAAMLYEAVEPERSPCLYVHHDLSFPVDEYIAKLREHGFAIEILEPFLGYFELIDRGISFLTRTGAWCIPMLIGTAFLEWLQQRGARTPRGGVMFRGISGSECSRKYHSPLELYEGMGLPCFNPLLGFSKQEIFTLIRSRYGLPLNPAYQHLDRTGCICCYTPNAATRNYSGQRFPEVCRRYYGHIERMLFASGLIKASRVPMEYRTPIEQVVKHGFMHWRRTNAQDIAGAVKRRLPSGVLAYRIREAEWIATKHLEPVKGRWARRENEIRFWEVPERKADAIIKRMINCLDCGFCLVQCFSCRRFDRTPKTLKIEECFQCGRCLSLKFCMGWRHRFWRRVIVED